MDLENYTNINIYKRTFEEREVANCHNMIEQPHNHLAPNKEHRGFNPYQNNEGTVVGKWILRWLNAALSGKHAHGSWLFLARSVFNQVFCFSFWQPLLVPTS